MTKGKGTTTNTPPRIPTTATTTEEEEEEGRKERGDSVFPDPEQRLQQRRVSRRPHPGPRLADRSGDNRG